MTVDIATLAIRIDSMEAREATRDLDRLSGAGRRAEQQSDALSGAMRTLAGIFATMKIVDAAKALIDTQREFDKLNASLVTATGSVANAAQAFGALQSFAASTPYGLAEVTRAFIQLRNLGLTPSERALNSYGNTASAMGKSLNQMVEAVADAATGEFERLKEFGIKAKQNGDMVGLTFQGVTANIKNNAASIEKYLIGLGETKFAGGMELQAKTLDGAISNLGDSWDATKLAFSQSGFGDATMGAVLSISVALQDLQAVLHATGLAASKEGTAVEEIGVIHKALTATFELAAISGELISYTIRNVGKGLGAFAAAAAAVLQGQFSDVAAIYAARKADAEDDKQQTDARIEKILWASAVEKKVRENAAAEKEREQQDNLAQFGVKQAAATQSAEAIKKEAEAYAGLITSIRSSIAENRLELAVGTEATESQKTGIKLTQELASGKLKLGAAHLAAVRAALAEQAATEQLLKVQQSEKSTLDWIIASTQARLAARDSLAAEYQLYGQSADAREIAMIAIKAEAELEADLVAKRKAGEIVTEEMIAQMRREKDMRVDVMQTVLAQTKALGYAQQLADENKRFAAESILNERDRAAAILAIDAEVWQKRIEMAGEGTEAQKKLQEQYVTWYANQTNKPMVDQWRDSVKKYDDIFRQGFADMVNNGKSGWASFTKSLTTTFKTSVADQIYKMFAQPFVMKLVASLLGVTGSAASGVVSAATSAGSSAIGTGLGMAGMGAAFGSSAMAGLTAAWGAGGSLAATLSTAVAGATAAPMASLGLAMGALAPIALGLGAAIAIWKSQDTSGTYHTGGAATASAAGVSTIRAESLNFQGTQKSADTEKFVSGLATGIVSILDSTALAFGKTAGYTAATAFADDTSKDGAWGGLVIEKLGSKIVDWQDTRTSRWAPKEFSDGAAGQAEYLAALGGSVRAALDGIGLPSWAGTMLDALGDSPSIETLTSTVQTIVATEKALSVLGDKLVGFAGLSDAAASALMAASGGIDALATNASTYYDNFYSAEEKAAATTKQVADALAAVGLAMPATREAYRAEVEAQLKLGESGAKAVAVLLGMNVAFASVTAATDQVTAATEQATAAANSAADILRERQSLQDQLDELTMSSSQLLDKQRAALDESNRALFDQVQAAKAAKDSADAMAEQIKQVKDAYALSAQETAAANAKADSALQSFVSTMQSTYEKITATTKALQQFSAQIYTGDMSPISAGAQYASSRAALASATPDNAQAAVTTFLKLAQGRDTRLEYSRDVAYAQSVLQSIIGTNDEQIAAADRSFAAVVKAMSLGAVGGPAINGSHMNGLETVPFDNYVAKTHKDEAILTAPQARAWRAGGDSALIAAVNGLGEKLDRLHAASEATAVNTSGTTRLLKEVTINGVLQTEIPA